MFVSEIEQNTCRKSNPKEVNIDLIVLHLNLYCFKEFYKEKKDSRKYKFGLYFENISLRTSLWQNNAEDTRLPEKLPPTQIY